MIVAGPNDVKDGNRKQIMGLSWPEQQIRAATLWSRLLRAATLARMTTNGWTWAGLAVVAAGGLAMARSAAADPPAAAGTGAVHAALPEPKTAVESAARALLGSVSARRVVGNDRGGFELWLVSTVDFDRAAELARATVSSRRTLDEGFRLEGFTWLEPDRSYLMDLKGGGRLFRVRLTAHLSGSLLEVHDGGDATSAPVWAPTWRPRPVLLRHGPAR